VQKGTSALGQKGTFRHSFNQLVGAQQECLANFQAERLCGRQIDDEVELGRLLDRDVARLRTA
jgi:hypothetical protein